MVLLGWKVFDEGLLGELFLERFLIVLLLFVHCIEYPQVVLVAGLERRMQLEEALLRLGERLDQIEELGAGLHRKQIEYWDSK